MGRGLTCSLSAAGISRNNKSSSGFTVYTTTFSQTKSIISFDTKFDSRKRTCMCEVYRNLNYCRRKIFNNEISYLR